MRPLALDLRKADLALALCHGRRIAMSLSAGILYSTAPFSIASSALMASTKPNGRSLAATLSAWRFGFWFLRHAGSVDPQGKCIQAADATGDGARVGGTRSGQLRPTLLTHLQPPGLLRHVGDDRWGVLAGE